MKKKLFLSLIGIFVSLILSTYAFSLTLYDDFSGTYIDKTKWRQGEMVREIQEGKLVSKLTGYGAHISNNLNFRNPASITYIEADVTLEDIEGSYDPGPPGRSSFPGAQLTGRFYNDGTGSPESLVGEVQAAVRIGFQSGPLKALWIVQKNLNANGSSQQMLGIGEFPISISLEQTYKLSILWEPALKRLTFSVGDTSLTWTSSDTIYPSNSPWRALQTYVWIAYPDLGGRVSAIFDNVVAKDESGNIFMTDDFSSAVIDSTKWITYEFVREISEGKLRSEVRSSSASNSTNYNQLHVLNPSSMNVIQANVTPVAYENEEGRSIITRIGGIYFNDGTPGGGYRGDVWAQLFIGGYNGEANPVAGWAVGTYADVNANVAVLIQSGTFSKSISLGNSYNLLMGWTGTQFIFKIDEEVAHYTPVTSINPPNKPFRDLCTRVLSPAGKEATIEVLFDDVMVGAACCPAIDVNPRSIDFGKVLPGGTSDQTVIITNVGSITLTLGTIGSPSPPFSITGGTCTNNQTLPPQGSCNLIIRFAPTAYGVYTSSFSIPSDDPARPIVTVDPVNGTSPDHFTLTVSKSGTGNGTVTSSPAGINCGSDCTEDFKVGTKITLKAKADTNSTFTGWSGGGCSGTGTCVVIMNADIAVTAAFAAKTPDISVPTSSVDFGSLTVVKKITKTLKIANNGSGDLLITLSGLEGTDFSIQGSSSVTIKAKKSYTLKVLCTPTSAGLKTATLKIDSNDPVTPTLEISLTAVLPATTPDISVTQNSLDFGSVKVGKKVTKTLKIGNNGTGDLMITLSGLEETDFSIQGSSSVTIKGKKSYSLKVLFTPTSAELKTATLKITSNDPDTPTIDISLSGTGQ